MLKMSPYQLRFRPRIGFLEGILHKSEDTEGTRFNDSFEWNLE